MFGVQFFVHVTVSKDTNLGIRKTVHELYSEESHCRDLVPVIWLEEMPEGWVHKTCNLSSSGSLLELSGAPAGRYQRWSARLCKQLTGVFKREKERYRLVAFLVSAQWKESCYLCWEMLATLDSNEGCEVQCRADSESLL